jgi:hypothetical protein
VKDDFTPERHDLSTLLLGENRSSSIEDDTGQILTALPVLPLTDDRLTYAHGSIHHPLEVRGVDGQRICPALF